MKRESINNREKSVKFLNKVVGTIYFSLLRVWLTENDCAYFMKITCSIETLKEKAMKTLLEQRFEA